jgi:heme ABC exporter ATP-binding subunit CcmA
METSGATTGATRPESAGRYLRSMHTGLPDRAITLSGLGKRFGARWVLRGVTFDVSRGEVVGLLGANGSGKSTVLRILGTLLSPTAGAATIDGLDVAREGSKVRGRVGYLAHTPGLYDDLTARENLRFAADMLGLPFAAVEESLERVGLAHVAGDRVRGFSAGMQRRLGIARLRLRAPRILLLDEPYSNLDTEGIELMNSILGDVVRSGGAALVALHELSPARGVLARTASLVDGRIEPVDTALDRSNWNMPVSVAR